jgi:group I intron endonuclease
MDDLRAGIYIWQNTLTKRTLVGQTSCFRRRYNEYMSLLTRNIYGNEHFQRSWNKYGAQSFKFSILEVVDNRDFLTYYEQVYIEYYRHLSGGVYNQLGPADSPRRGCRHSVEARAKISAALRNRPAEKNHWIGRRHTDSSKQKISQAKLGVPLGRPTEEHRKKISLAKMGVRVHTPESRAKMSRAKRGKLTGPRPAAVVQKMAAANRARWDSLPREPVERIDCMSGECIEYGCIREAFREGFCSTKIRECIRGVRKSHAGYYWCDGTI